MWPYKTPQNVKAVTGRSLRTVKYQLAGASDLKLSDAVALLRSEHGFSLLAYLMAGAEPFWWRGIIKARNLASTRKALADAQRRLAQMEMDLE